MPSLAIITGGSRGLGAALCKRYANAGWQILEFSRRGTGAHTVHVDFSNVEQTSAAMRAALDTLSAHEYEEIVAINNAATLSPMGGLAQQDFDEVIANTHVNFTAGILFVKSVISAFEHHRCHKTIVNISSGAALQPLAGWSLYCASKAGLEHFVRCTALDQAGKSNPFTLLNLGPGVMDTDMQARIREADSTELPMVEYFRALKTSGALRRPEDVATFVMRVAASCPANGSRVDIDIEG